MSLIETEWNEIGDWDDAEDEALSEYEEGPEIIGNRIEVNDEADDEEDVHVDGD